MINRKAPKQNIGSLKSRLNLFSNGSTIKDENPKMKFGMNSYIRDNYSVFEK